MKQWMRGAQHTLAHRGKAPSRGAREQAMIGPRHHPFRHLCLFIIIRNINTYTPSTTPPAPPRGTHTVSEVN